jgi:hypothetical protein
MTTFEAFVLCHLIGDYFVQNNWMALNKSKNKLPLIVHSTLYGLVFGVVFQSILVFFAVTILHCIGDASYKGATLTEWWLRLIHGRSLQSVLDPPKNMLCQHPAATSIYASFSAIVYCVVDFIIHFTLQYPLLAVLF